MARFARFLYHVSKPQGSRGRSAILCSAHRRLSKDIAVEGTVLLKNDGLLPLAHGTRLCPFGNGIGNFLFGGGGSGFVVSDRMITLSDALRAETDLEVFTPLLDFYRDNADRDPMTMPTYEQLDTQGLLRCPVLPEELYDQAKAFGGVALLAALYNTSISLSVVSLRKVIRLTAPVAKAIIFCGLRNRHSSIDFGRILQRFSWFSMSAALFLWDSSGIVTG